MALAPALLDAGLTVVDCSADFRLHGPGRLRALVRGAAHRSRAAGRGGLRPARARGASALPGARLVACPGCYPTATLLAAAARARGGPRASAARVIVDAKSGVSGAGRRARRADALRRVNESLAPYKVGAHRHTPEIAQGLAAAAGAPVAVAFTPHLVPMTRGLLATVYLDAAPGLTAAEAAVAPTPTHYAGEPFVTVHPPGGCRRPREVTGTNRAHIGVAVDEASRTLIVACAIDNLGQGHGGPGGAVRQHRARAAPRPPASTVPGRRSCR